jgi:3-oxoacyl-[acyl-carrier protein] reductase
MGRTVLITGAAKGLGAGLARGLAKDGHRVAIHFRTSKSEAIKVLELIRAEGGDAELFQSPLVDLADGERLVQEIVARFGHL